MRPRTRLLLSALVILGSSVYAVIVAINPSTASAIASGYVAVLATIFILATVWKKPHE